MPPIYVVLSQVGLLVDQFLTVSTQNSDKRCTNANESIAAIQGVQTEITLQQEFAKLRRREQFTTKDLAQEHRLMRGRNLMKLPS